MAVPRILPSDSVGPHVLYIFISPNRGCSSTKDRKNMPDVQQNKQTKKKKINYIFTQKSVNLLSNLVSRFRHKSLDTSNEKTFLTIFDTINITRRFK